MRVLYSHRYFQKNCINRSNWQSFLSWNTIFVHFLNISPFHVTFWHVVLQLCLTSIMLHSLRAALFSVTVFFMFYSYLYCSRPQYNDCDIALFHVVLASCCTLLRFLFFHVASFWCWTLSCCNFCKLDSFYVVLFSCFTFFKLNFFHVTLFQAPLTPCCARIRLHFHCNALYSLWTLFILHSFHVAFVPYSLPYLLQSFYVALVLSSFFFRFFHLNFFHVAFFLLWFFFVEFHKASINQVLPFSLAIEELS